MDLPDLRALSFGELLDRTFTYFRRHFWLFVAIMAVPQAVILVVDLGLEGFERAFLLNASGAPSPVAGTHFITTTLIGSAIIAITIFVVYAVALGATTFAVSEVYLGRAASARAAYQRVWRRFWSLIDLDMRVAVQVILAFVLFGVGSGVLGGLASGLARNGSKVTAALVGLLVVAGCVVGLVYAVRFILRYACAVPALLLENVRAGTAIKRSVALTRKQLGRVFLIGVLMSIVTYMVGLILEGPFLFAEMYMAIKHHTHPAFWLTACGGVMGSIGYIVTGPLLMIGLVLFYYDVRVRKEGFDLQVMMAALDAKEPVPDASLDPVLPAAPELEKSSLALLVILTIITFGLYYPVWFMRRRDGINGLQSREKLGVGVFAFVFGLLLLSLLVNAGQGYIAFISMSWLRSIDSVVWMLSGVLMLLQVFKVRRIVEDHSAHSDGGLLSGSISLAQDSSLSGVATFFFGIFYLQHKLNEMLEVWAKSQPSVGTGTVPVV